MAKIRSFGAELYLNGISVGGLVDISASGTEVSMIDTTSHDESSGFKTFLSGLKDGGTLEISGKYNYADAGQAEWKAEEGISHLFYILLSDNSGFGFNAIVGGFQTSNPLDDAVEFTATAKITGPVSLVFPTITVTGITTPAASDPLEMVLTAMNDGRPKWTVADWTLSYSTSDSGWILEKDATADYEALKVSSSITPVGLTSWTISTGAGQPILTV